MATEIDWDDVEVDTTISTPARDTGQLGPGISRWSGHGRIKVGDPYSDEARTILWMNGVVVDRWTSDPGIYRALDAMSSDYEKLAAAVFDTQSNSLRQEIDDLLDLSASRVVLIDRVSLEPEFRSRGGIGRVLIGYILRHLMGDGDSIAVTFPHPFEAKSDEPGFDRELRKVRHVWESIGFFPVNEDVWILDMTAPAHSLAVKRLEERLGI